MNRFLAVTLLTGAVLAANVRVNINLGVGHPISRPRTVVVHRAPLVVERGVVYAPPVFFEPAIVSLPPRARLVWQDSETIARDEEWVDTNLPRPQLGRSSFPASRRPRPYRLRRVPLPQRPSPRYRLQGSPGRPRRLPPAQFRRNPNPLKRASGSQGRNAQSDPYRAPPKIVSRARLTTWKYT